MRPAGPPYVPLDGRPYRLAVGLRTLDPADWIEVDEHRPAEMRTKDALLRTAHDDVVATLPAADDASGEALDLLVEHLRHRFPHLYAWHGRQVTDRQTGLVTDLDALHPVDAAGRLVQEDLAVMLDAGGTWALGAASVCFPSRWSLREKLGRPLDAIHAPVPGYAERIGGPSRQALDRLIPQRPVWRLNWTLLADPELHQPAAAPRAETPPVTDPGSQLWFRVERQTLRRLPRTGAALFTIRTYVTPLAGLARRPGALPALAAALATAPDAMVAYKGWAALREPVLAWCARQAGAGRAE